MNPNEPDDSASVSHYAIEAVAEITHVSRRLIIVYCRHGLVSPVAKPEESGWLFDEDAIHRLRHIEHLRTEYGMNMAGVRMMLETLGELEQLREELRFLRGR
jgi:DNA-binding transcriptional MerR regulator